ncbi:cyclin [Plasmodium gonderi]|uniref:Cyclin n=1 Tax=Plasmodium gonderi TaxID=77519 RepID=A0A1Y1JLX2_PLAGO|nr:cyclin [Plasmodium gonderi]GAW81373.1 cyclin [Plasmodium gonderi]
MEYETGADAPRTDRKYISYIPIVLENMIKQDRGEGKITSFHASKIPDISIKNYVERISKYIGCSNECFVLLMIYIDRIIKLNKDISLSLLCIHRLLITATMISAKFFDDLYYSNDFYAKVGGVSTQEINKLESNFLHLIDYKLFVSSEEYDFYRHSISLAVEKYLSRLKNGQTRKKKEHTTAFASTRYDTKGDKCDDLQDEKCRGKDTVYPHHSTVKPYNLFNYTAPHRTNIMFINHESNSQCFHSPRGS